MKKLLLIPIIILLFVVNALAMGPATLMMFSGGCVSGNDTFTGSNDDPPNTDLWTETDSTTYLDIQSNKLNYATLDDTTYRSSDITSTWTFPANSNFDVQIDFDVTTLDAPDSSLNYCPGIEIRNSGGSIKTQVIRVRTTTNDGYAKSGSATGYDEYTQADATGKLRIVMTGCPGACVLKGYIWDAGNTQWEWEDNTDGVTFSEDYSAAATYAKIQWLKQGTVGNTQVVGNVDNFTVNTGCPQ